MSPPVCCFNLAISPTIFPSRIVELVHSAFLSVDEATYFDTLFYLVCDPISFCFREDQYGASIS